MEAPVSSGLLRRIPELQQGAIKYYSPLQQSYLHILPPLEQLALKTRENDPDHAELMRRDH